MTMGSRIGKIWLGVGYLFLYLPIFTLIIVSQPVRIVLGLGF